MEGEGLKSPSLPHLTTDIKGDCVMYYIFDGCGNCLFCTDTKPTIEMVFGNAPDDICIYDFSVMFIPKDTPTIDEFEWY